MRAKEKAGVQIDFKIHACLGALQLGDQGD
jgi:hypothetical protein